MYMYAVYVLHWRDTTETTGITMLTKSPSFLSYHILSEEARKTHLLCWPCTSNTLHMCPLHGTGQYSGVAGGYSRTLGCATPPLPEWWPRSSSTPLPPPSHSPDQRQSHPAGCRWAQGYISASVRHCRFGGGQRWTEPGVKMVRVIIGCDRIIILIHRSFQTFWSGMWSLVFFVGLGIFPESLQSTNFSLNRVVSLYWVSLPNTAQSGRPWPFLPHTPQVKKWIYVLYYNTNNIY